MEFIISGIHFPISEEMKNYRYYRKLFSDLANQVANEFDALYTKQNHRLEDIIQNGSNQYAQCMYPVIQTALKCLAENDILSNTSSHDILVFQFEHPYMLSSSSGSSSSSK